MNKYAFPYNPSTRKIYSSHIGAYFPAQHRTINSHPRGHPLSALWIKSSRRSLWWTANQPARWWRLNGRCCNSLWPSSDDTFVRAVFRGLTLSPTDLPPNVEQTARHIILSIMSWQTNRTNARAGFLYWPPERSGAPRCGGCLGWRCELWQCRVECVNLAPPVVGCRKWGRLSWRYTYASMLALGLHDWNG